MNKQEIETNLSLIKIELEREVDTLNITDVQNKLMSLTSYSGLSAETIRYSRSLVLKRQKDVLEDLKEEKLNPSILKMKIESDLWEEISLHTYADRINAAITHSCDSLRTVISLYKAEMQSSL